MKVVQLYDENLITGADQRVPVHPVGGFIKIAPISKLNCVLSVENLFQY